jgi:L-rhamnose-H+ transport protein
MLSVNASEPTHHVRRSPLTMIPSNPLLGTAFHAVGALSSSACYAPQKKVRNWSWQTYWLTQAAFCWFLLPIVGAALTIPHLFRVLAEAPREAMAVSFLLGMAYGVGGTAFNISIRYIGFSLTYAIAVGLSSILGTLVPPLIQHRVGAFLHELLWNGRLTQPLDYKALGTIFSKSGADWVLTGVAVGALGIAICGVAGRLKEKHLQSGKSQGEFSLSKGLLLSLLAGVLSAVYGFSLEAGEPIADTATAYGAGVWRGNVVYIFSNTGAFVTTAIYCLFLHARHRTLGELIELPAGPEKANLPMNFALAALTGLLWYGQFFFYNLGHVRMGEYKFSSWAIHMIMLVLFSNLVAVLFREWTGCRRSTQLAITLALAVLVIAILAITYGNYLGEAMTGAG